MIHVLQKVSGHDPPQLLFFFNFRNVCCFTNPLLYKLHSVFLPVQTFTAKTRHSIKTGLTSYSLLRMKFNSYRFFPRETLLFETDSRNYASPTTTNILSAKQTKIPLAAMSFRRSAIMTLHKFSLRNYFVPKARLTCSHVFCKLKTILLLVFVESLQDMGNPKSKNKIQLSYFPNKYYTVKQILEWMLS